MKYVAYYGGNTVAFREYIYVQNDKSIFPTLTVIQFGVFLQDAAESARLCNYHVEVTKVAMWVNEDTGLLKHI